MMVKWMVRIADTDAKQFIDRPFHKTLPKSGSQMHRISVRFYEMDDMSLCIS